MQYLSKLPNEKTTIFTIMSRLAQAHNAINLAQGFPGFQTDKHLHNLVTKAINNGYNQYAPMPGIYSLRKRIVEKTNTLHNSNYCPETDITITNGATQAIYTAIASFIRPGDEVIIFKPAYDSYEPSVKVHGGFSVPIQLVAPDYKVDWAQVKEAITPRTKMIIINSPHNPTGTLLTKEDMQMLEAILEGTNIILLSDEVYEHIIFDGKEHQSAARFKNLRDRSLISGSFGKTFHNTGWKVGYILGPAVLIKEFQKVHQYTVFSVHHPSQKALAMYLENEEHYLKLGYFFQQKRDLFIELLENTRFKAIPSKGTYFQLVDYSDITKERDIDFAKRLTVDYGVASIPISVFNKKGIDDKKLRFCFAKNDDILIKAAKILEKI